MRSMIGASNRSRPAGQVTPLGDGFSVLRFVAGGAPGALLAMQRIRGGTLSGTQGTKAFGPLGRNFGPLG